MILKNARLNLLNSYRYVLVVTIWMVQGHMQTKVVYFGRFYNHDKLNVYVYHVLKLLFELNSYRNTCHAFVGISRKKPRKSESKIRSGFIPRKSMDREYIILISTC